MTDTHCHLYDEAFTADVEACIVRAREAGVTQMMLACCDETEWPRICDLCRRHPDTLLASLGLHPENMAADVDAQLARIDALRHAPTDVPIRAIGEIGLDLHWDKTRLDDQRHALQVQLDWALADDLPVLLHIRDAMPQFLDFLHAYIYNRSGGAAGTECQPRLRGILHCYSGTVDEARQAMELADLLIGVGGTVTYKKSLVPDVVRAFGLDHVVLETDAPYLAPVPHRGQRNEPAYTADTARCVAQLLGVTLDEVERITTDNARRLFRLP